MQLKETAIVWFTHNLRVQDNRVLYEACNRYERVIGIYCFDILLFSNTQFQFKKIEKFRAKFLIETVQDLSLNLEKYNIPLEVHFDDPSSCIPEVVDRYNAKALFYQKEFTAEEKVVIDAVTQNIPEGVQTFSYYDQFLFEPELIPFHISSLPEVFSNFRKRVEKEVQVAPVYRIQEKPNDNLVEVAGNIPTLIELGFQQFELPRQTAFPFAGGETEAVKRLDHYFFQTKKLGYYKKTRNGLVGIDYSSKFSAWLANGSISARTIYHKVKQFESEYGSNQSTYWLIFELIWRDYFKFIAMKHGDSLFYLNGIQNQSYEWSKDPELVYEWIHGKTNEPFVNANMIELKETGWMSNRGRQNVASYFAKELLLDWRIGAAYFESMLIDYDVHSNYGNWQYVSGVGNDPRNRKFNVRLQAERYDPRGTYQRMWLQPSLF